MSFDAVLPPEWCREFHQLTYVSFKGNLALHKGHKNDGPVCIEQFLSNNRRPRSPYRLSCWQKGNLWRVE